MHDILKKLAPTLRKLGFGGSGQNYTKIESDFVCVVNFQGSRWRDTFYVNLGAQPVFIPAEGQTDFRKLKEYNCILRRRVGGDWPWQMSDESVAALEAQLLVTQSEFFGNALTLRASFAVDSPETLLQKFSSGTTEARATLHLARVGIALGNYEKAYELARRGLELAGDKGTILRAQLNEILEGKQDARTGASENVDQPRT